MFTEYYLRSRSTDHFCHFQFNHCIDSQLQKKGAKTRWSPQIYTEPYRNITQNITLLDIAQQKVIHLDLNIIWSELSDIEIVKNEKKKQRNFILQSNWTRNHDGINAIHLIFPFPFFLVFNLDLLIFFQFNWSTDRYIYGMVWDMYLSIAWVDWIWIKKMKIGLRVITKL